MKIQIHGYRAVSIKVGNLELEFGYFPYDNPVLLELCVLGIQDNVFYFFDIEIWKFDINFSLDL